MSNPNQIRIILASGGGAGSSNLHTHLSSLSGLSLIASTDNASAMLETLKTEQADVVILDLSAYNGIQFTRMIRECSPVVKILMSAGSNHEEDIFAVIDTGADGYVLRGNYKGLEMAIRSLRLGMVWLDPAIAEQVLDVIVGASRDSTSRTLPTGMFVMPLLPDEKNVLQKVAASTCVDGLCMVNPDFMANLRRFAPAQ